MDEHHDACHVSIAETVRLRRQAEQREKPEREGRAEIPLEYRRKMGRELIRLNNVEYGILAFLAASPYRAFTPRRIVEAVSTERFPLREETLGEHIASLRDKLGFFRDYIQSVPYIGYRFKA